jgi:hypothetical protein
MREGEHIEVRGHRRRRPSVAHGETAAGRHDRASRALYPYTGASVPAMREALDEDWRPGVSQDSWSSAAHMDPPRDDRRPAHDPYRPMDITDRRYVAADGTGAWEPVFGGASVGAGADPRARRSPG